MTAKLYSGGIAEAVDHSNVRPIPYQLSPVASRGDLKKLYTILAIKNIKPNAIMSAPTVEIAFNNHQPSSGI